MVCTLLEKDVPVSNKVSLSFHSCNMKRLYSNDSIKYMIGLQRRCNIGCLCQSFGRELHAYISYQHFLTVGQFDRMF